MTSTSLLHLALAQFKPRKGDYAANLARVGDIFAEVAPLEPRPRVLLLPETILTGYFVEGGVRDLAVTAGTLARDLSAEYARRVPGGATLDVVIGFYEVWRNTLYNSAMYVTLGQSDLGEPSEQRYAIRHVHRKTFLPTYGLFDEERFVERGHEVRAFATPWGRAGILVCEDAWHSLSGTLAALDGAQVIFIPTAAPARGVWPREDGVPGPASVARWERLVRDIAEEHGVFVALANHVGSEGGKTFGGSSTVAGPKGDLRLRGPVFDEAIMTLTIDLGDLTRARADMPLLADLQTAMPHLRDALAAIESHQPFELEYDPAPPAEASVGRRERGRATGAAAAGESAPASPTSGPAEGSAGGEARGSATGPSSGRESGRAATLARGAPPKTQDGAATSDGRHRLNASGFELLRADRSDHGLPATLEIDGELVEQWLITFIRDELRRRRFSKAVIGVSGGVDSAVTAYLAARALGPENVVGVRLPYRTSSPTSLEHAQLVIDALGIEARTLDISAAVDGYLANEPDADAARRGNVMARMRMIALFDLSAKHRALPLGTGNKTERLFGYFTWHADDSPPVNPLGDLFKTQVWALARYLGVPEVIVGKPASADLITGQTDEGDFGISYAKADLLLNWMLSGYTADALVERGFEPTEVEVVRRRLEGTHWKRKLPTVAMVSPTAIGESYLRPVDY